MYHLIEAPDPDAVVAAADPAVIAVLRAAHLSRRALLIRAAAAQATGPAATAVARLAEVQRAHPAAAARALAHPYVGVWAARAARGAGPDTDLGWARLAAAAAGGMAAPRPGRLVGSATFAPVLDDSDPYRDCYGTAPLPALSDAEFARWDALFTQAWELLAEVAPDAASTVAATLTTITPLPTRGGGDGVSISARTAFGAAGLSLPASAATLAATLVHEARHSLLNGVMDLLPVCRGDERACYSPWRPDPRPVAGLLHGVYAFAGVVPFWRGMAERAADPRAADHYHRTLAQVRRGLDELAGSPALTPYGQALVAALARAAQPAAEPAPDAVRHALRAHWLRWRLANTRPDPAQVRDLAQAYLAGAPAPRQLPRSAVLADAVPQGPAADGIVPVLDPARRALVAAQLRAHPEQAAPWVEFGLHLPGDSEPGVARPELLRALCCELAAAGARPDPGAVAHWLTGR